MDFKIVEKEKFNLLAKVKAFRNEFISKEENREIPDFWNKCVDEGVFEVLNKYTENHDVYGVCAPISKESDYFDYVIGMKYNGEFIPEGYRIWEVKPTLWAVFQCIGSDAQCISETWDRIFKEFLPSSGYNMLDETDLEFYSADNNTACFCEIWIPVEKK